ncbi:DUF1168-domain-containing protein [Dendrothele bispora CBS 962.96]|uniref:DUF1168-domain-containing protein n=1 Tax=Dendrothele bispora (strain CBS 962.96) TaxID=1314807 RepID=A0A4S8M1Z4_DENBC|nr:DUF1168-domain-containing protein [Dendrothele bispora CBS 962.96]
MSTDPSSATTQPANRHALSAVERQRVQLDKLLKDPSKPAYVPTAPKEKTIRPAREMMKTVQGSSAGAGSGEFHVYKASRRREYERLNLLEEAARKEVETAEYDARRREQEASAEAKTAKNRAKRQKKKERAKNKTHDSGPSKAERTTDSGASDVPFKKRRLVNGKELVFRPQEDADEEDEDEDEGPQPASNASERAEASTTVLQVPVADEPRITIHEDD